MSEIIFKGFLARHENGELEKVPRLEPEHPGELMSGWNAVPVTVITGELKDLYDKQSQHVWDLHMEINSLKGRLEELELENTAALRIINQLGAAFHSDNLIRAVLRVREVIAAYRNNKHEARDNSKS